jgi:hypothetical protein
MAVWHVAIGDKQFSVETVDELRRWIAEDRLKPEHYVFTQGFSDWLPVSAVPALMAPPTLPETDDTEFDFPPKWKLWVNGKQYRSDSLDEIRRWRDEGRIRPHDYLWHPMSMRWIQLCDAEHILGR